MLSSKLAVGSLVVLLTMSVVTAARPGAGDGIRLEPLPGAMGRYLRLFHFPDEPLRVSMIENRLDDEHWVEGLVIEVENTNEKPVAEAEYDLHFVDAGGDSHHVLRLWLGNPEQSTDADSVGVADQLAPGSRATLRVLKGEQLHGTTDELVPPGTVGVLVLNDVQFVDGSQWHHREYCAALAHAAFSVR
jgi:hypothetical protein